MEIIRFCLNSDSGWKVTNSNIRTQWIQVLPWIGSEYTKGGSILTGAEHMLIQILYINKSGNEKMVSQSLP